MDNDTAASSNHSSSPHATAPPTPTFSAVVSEDSDDYVHLNPPAGASTSTSLSFNADSEGLRERSRAPYSVAGPSIVPKREEVQHRSSTPDQAPSSSISTTDKGKQKAEEKPEPNELEPNDNPFACHICLEVPATDDAVLSKCGHLFCCKCLRVNQSPTYPLIRSYCRDTGSDLSAWLESNPPSTSQCPVCKAQIKDIQEDVIPIYSGGGSSSNKKQIDPRTKPRPKPRVMTAPQPSTSRLGNFFGGGTPGPWSAFGDPTGPAGWTVQAGIFPFPGLSMGWSGGTRPVHLAGPRGMTMGTYAGMPHGAPMTAEMQEQARRQQRNALIAFVVMIILFSLLATIGEMDMD